MKGTSGRSLGPRQAPSRRRQSDQRSRNTSRGSRPTALPLRQGKRQGLHLHGQRAGPAEEARGLRKAVPPSALNRGRRLCSPIRVNRSADVSQHRDLQQPRDVHGGWGGMRCGLNGLLLLVDVAASVLNEACVRARAPVGDERAHQVLRLPPPGLQTRFGSPARRSRMSCLAQSPLATAVRSQPSISHMARA
jgi:hypothetical protein